MMLIWSVLWSGCYGRSVVSWKGEVRETLNRTMNKYMEQKHARDSRFR